MFLRCSTAWALLGRVGIGIVLALLAGCVPHRGIAKLSGVPRCLQQAGTPVPTEWKQAGQRDGFAFYLPPSCTPDAAPNFVHGGDRWVCGTIGVDIVWGMWGRDSFGSDDECRSTLTGVTTYQSTRIDAETGTRRQLVWYLTGRIHEPILSAWSKETSDQPAIDAITHSGMLFAIRR
jgi:hypothetical protein